MRSLLDKFIRTNDNVKYMQYADFGEITEIGSGGYSTIYTAKFDDRLRQEFLFAPETIVLKRFKCFDQTSELFISEVSNL